MAPFLYKYLFFFKLYSKKIKAIGENSFGQFDTGGNVNYKICNYEFKFPIEMGQHVFYERYDFKGITPMVPHHGNETDWLKQVMEYLQQIVLLKQLACLWLIAEKKLTLSCLSPIQ